MATSVCRFFQFGHCKMDNRCSQIHKSQIPKNCRYLRTFGFCKFGDFCSIPNQAQSPTQYIPVEGFKIAKENLQNEFREIIEEKDSEIKKLTEEISRLVMKIDTVEDDRKINLEVNSNETLNELDDSEKLECDLCDFKTDKEVGLKIHKSKKHIIKCE